MKWLLLAIPLLCSAFDRGYPTDCNKSAYNEGALYQLGNRPWDFWVDGSFIYWNAEEEGLDLGISSTDNGSLLQPMAGKFLFQDTEFRPGFKAGLGFSMDSSYWATLIEYTWIRSQTTTNSQAPSDPRGGVPVYIMSNWFSRQTNVAANALTSKWRLHMDLLDLCFTRPFYQGTHLIVTPFGGLRAQWIRQRLSIHADIFTSSSTTPGQNAKSINKSNSWAIGPRAGMQGQYHLLWGFRIEGDLGASLLFTRYLTVSGSQSPTASIVGAGGVSGHFYHYNALRLVNELNLGLGWGSYLNCRNYHLDFLATYDFQVFWNQNMMRQIADTLADGGGNSPTNLYLQGLTVKARFDF